MDTQNRVVAKNRGIRQKIKLVTYKIKTIQISINKVEDYYFVKGKTNNYSLTGIYRNSRSKNSLVFSGSTVRKL